MSGFADYTALGRSAALSDVRCFRPFSSDVLRCAVQGGHGLPSQTGQLYLRLALKRSNSRCVRDWAANAPTAVEYCEAYCCPPSDIH